MEQPESKTALDILLENKPLLKKDAPFFNTMIDKVKTEDASEGKSDSEGEGEGEG